MASKKLSERGHRPSGLPARKSKWFSGPALGGAAVLVVGVALVIGFSAGSGPSSPAGSGTGQARSANALPPGTQVFAENDHRHVTGQVQYNRNPPAGGPHSAIWMNCGIYDTPLPNVNAVHSMEHGTVWITYRPGLAPSQLKILQDLAVSLYTTSQRYVLVSPYPGLPAPIVASTWGAQLKVNSVSAPALSAFIRYFAGGGQGGEPGAPCTGGLGSPIR